MFLTRECDYGIRVIRSLADGAKKTIDTIANEEHIPKKYAYKIVKKLEHGGLVRSTRGRGGGYQINKELDSFTIADIITSVDSNRFINDCLKESSECPFRDHALTPCTVHSELKRIQDMVLAELSAKPISQVLIGG